MTTPGGYVSNEVIALQLGNLTEEIKMLRTELVRRDVYEEQRRADRMELDSIRTAIASASQRRWGLVVMAASGGVALAWQLLAGLMHAANP